MKFFPVAQPVFGKDETRFVLDCLDSSWISSSGKYIDQFEVEFANLTKTRYAVSTSNGTAAIHLALLALGIGPGDEVIVPALSFVATANAVKYVGATPIFVDITPGTWTIDPLLIEKKITPRTRALLPVHLYGYPTAMKQITQLAQEFKLAVIEDAAEAHGAMYRGKPVGGLGDIGCFSFYGNKIITTGEGGMIVTNSKNIANKIRLLKNHGMSKNRKYYHPVLGYNYRMINVQAAIGLAQLRKITKFLKKRQEIARLYRKYLADIPGLIFQKETLHINPVCWLFSLLVTTQFGMTRDQLILRLNKMNIDSRPFFYPLPRLPMYKIKERFPISDRISRQGINLPTSMALSHNDIVYISETIKHLHR